MKPSLEKVELRDDELAEAIYRLINFYMLPDGTELVDLRTRNIFYEQMRKGYYYRLTWLRGTTEDQIMEWYANAVKILKFHELGLV